jgi:hypothetical protein
MAASERYTQKLECGKCKAIGEVEYWEEDGMAAAVYPRHLGKITGPFESVGKTTLKHQPEWFKFRCTSCGNDL